MHALPGLLATCVSPVCSLAKSGPAANWTERLGMSVDNAHSAEPVPGGLLLWDMAGTLLFVDPGTGKPASLPGCDVYLPELARDFRHVVTTGDTAAEARHQLGAHEILPHLVRIYADLHEPVGKPYGRVIAELGAGTGRMTVQYARDVACVVALDFSFESLLVLRDRLEPELRDKVVLVQADLCHLPLADGAFHKVASFQVLEHVPTPSARASALREARRVIRRGGRFVASVYNWSRSKQRRAARGVGDNSRKEGFHATTPPIYYYNFEAPELHALLADAGFHGVTLRGIYLELWWLLALGSLGLPLHERWGPTDRGRAHGHLLLAVADARAPD